MLNISICYWMGEMWLRRWKECINLKCITTFITMFLLMNLKVPGYTSEIGKARKHARGWIHCVWILTGRGRTKYKISFLKKKIGNYAWLVQVHRKYTDLFICIFHRCFSMVFARCWVKGAVPCPNPLCWK